MYVHISQHVII